MAQKHQIHQIIHQPTSQLERFSLGYEYNKTLLQVLSDVRARKIE